ncbi:MAG: hypothetical protein KIS92_13940 [Planctomycetota bacterium]|nr:hypothetical protein [Planctomycetota bacterium]
MDPNVANLIDPALLPDVLRHLQKVERLAAADTLRTWGMIAYFAAFAAASLLLLAWVYWPRARTLTAQGFRAGSGARGIARIAPGVAGGVLMMLLSAVSMQTGIDRNRGFIADRQRRMTAEILNAEARARNEYLQEHPLPPDAPPSREVQAEIKKAEDAARDDIVRSHYLYIPTGNSLRYLSLGNSAIAADYLWLTSLQYVTSPFRQGQKYDMLHRFYNEVLELDPHWIDIYVNAAKVLSAIDPDRYRTERFICSTITQNPGDFRLPMEAGRLFVVPTVNLKQSRDYSKRASEYFAQALSRQDLPKAERAVLEDLIGRLQREAGLHAAAAEKLWSIVTDPDVPKNLRESSSRELLQADSLVRADFFQTMVNAYKQRRGTYPASLQIALVDFVSQPGARGPKWLEEGLTGKTPLDAYGVPLAYNMATGEVASRGVQALRAIQASRIVESLSTGLYPAVKGHIPPDLKTLTTFIRQYYAGPQGPPYTVVESLGEELDAEINPLGEPWMYDPATGRVTLPPICNARELLRNADATLEGRMPPHFR